MNRMDFIILSILKEKKAVNRLSAMTIQEIQAEELPYPKNTVYKKVRAFLKDGYTALGLKDGHADTYYITAAGSGLLEEERCEK